MTPNADYVGRYRDVQLSLIEGLERPVGPLPLSVMVGTNAELIRAIAPLYLTGSVMDVTYGQGRWWDLYRPENLVYHDLARDGVDFRQLPHGDREFDSVTYDPPYVESGGVGHLDGFQDRYGLGRRRLPRGCDRLIVEGMSEVCRVARTFVLVKCMEYAQGGRIDFHDVPTLVTNAATDCGWIKHDQIVHHTGTGPGGHNIFRVKRARRAHSYLIVFTLPPIGRSEP